MVTDWCVPRIIEEINQYVGYINDISTLPMPIDLPQESSKNKIISFNYFYILKKDIII